MELIVRNSLRSIRGFGIVELMIAITLSLILGAAVIQSYLASKSSFSLRDAQSEIQENGRFAINAITQDIRAAGTAGCSNIDTLTSISDSNKVAFYSNVANVTTTVDNTTATDSSAAVVYTPTTIIHGYDDVAAGNFYNAIPLTDIITIRRLSSKGAILDGAVGMATSTSDLVLKNNAINVVKGDTVLIGNCHSAHLFRVSDITAPDPQGRVTIQHKTAGGYNLSDDFPGVAINKVGTAPPPPVFYRAAGAGVDSWGGAQLMAFQSSTYFIKDSGRKTANNNQKIYSLYQRSLGSGSVVSETELVPGIEDMQIEYGISTIANGPVTSYVAANQVPDWSKVVSVRINLLLQSTADNVVAKANGVQAQAIRFPLVKAPAPADSHVQVVIPPDGRLRQAIFDVAYIRNRVQLYP